ncbi:hypothetical protein GCM10023091_09590 [Ravibacter arvi]|uniref:Uncharacterized protein n=1 Tax=Ravibacter arvi TaxID=2051041 RepID=A0ABP8LR27_9BACT
MDEKLAIAESKTSIKDLVDIVLIFIIFLIPSMMLMGSNKYSVIYVAFLLMFILRGSLMSPFAYTVGTMFATYILPLGLQHLFKIKNRYQ